MLVFADNPNIDTAPLPVMVALAVLGFVLLRFRSTALRYLAEAIAGGRGTNFGKPVVVAVGYAALIGGIIGTLLWFVDNLA